MDLLVALLYLPAMTMYCALLLALRALTIFDGFTFTDVVDFTPVSTLFIGLTAAYALKRAPVKPASSALQTTMKLLALGPLLPHLALWGMASQFRSHAGIWPQAMVNDPMNLRGHISPFFDGLSELVTYLEAISGAWLVIFLVLHFSTRERIGSTQRRLQCGLAMGSLVLLAMDPGDLYRWWLD